ncbi:hypothetical protein PtA15_13A375 [Puccinia triticina]|uniref:DUF3752 domain-containing protein n=1 Tax=Puccinia triticina TaxID=208348 RepID=A0ABY7D261_9BASI|nr:uncharacterized protein PtA15_13A375 [Puccinia triticina]WAQ90975.1 hypothetical protein PtA15_13A375 [Puccinia triticina]
MSAPVAGPSSPPGPRINPKTAAVPKQTPAAEGADSDSEDEFMPSLPPALSASKPKAPIGPTLPPGFVIPDDHTNRSVEAAAAAAADDDDDDVAGPAPLPAHLAAAVGAQNEGVLALKEREERQKELDRIEQESKLLKREEWMLLPPKELDLQATIDPTKIKARGFKQTTKPHSSSTDRQTSAGSLWTETPAERSQRLADEAIGKRRRAEENVHDEGDDLEASKRKKRDKLMRQQVEEHNKSARNASLLDLHKTASVNVSNSKTKTEKESERKQAAVWDHDAMMGVNSKLLSATQKADLIKDAKGLGGRFGGGSFL